MARVESPKCLVHKLAVSEMGRDVGCRRTVERPDLDLDRAPSPVPSEVKTNVHGEPVKPGVEPLGVAKTRQIAPGADECLLDRVARELRVSKDQSGCRVQPREGRV